MKKKMITVLLCVSIWVTSCGTLDINTSKNTENVQVEGQTETNADTEQVQISEVDGMTVEYEKGTESYQVDDGTEVLTYDYCYPKVTAARIKEAADKINEDLLEQKEKDLSGMDDMVSEAKDYYASWNETQDTQEDTEYYYEFTPYSEGSNVNVKRNDGEILSFLKQVYFYSGGAHGNSTNIGMNYSTVTGEKLALDDLTDDAETFKQNIYNYVEDECLKEYYQQLLFEDYETYLKDAIFADDNWYFSKSGIVITCDPYMLGCYAVGTISFTIPYEWLNEHGLKEEYQYTGNFQEDIVVGGAVNRDIDGDGVEEAISYKVDYDSEKEGYTVALTVDGTDFSEMVADNMEMLDPWQDTYSLYDMDPTDNSIEIVLKDKGDDIDGVFTSYFYRYDADGFLTYLGHAQGDVSDADFTVEMQNLEQ